MLTTMVEAHDNHSSQVSDHLKRERGVKQPALMRRSSLHQQTFEWASSASPTDAQTMAGLEKKVVESPPPPLSSVLATTNSLSSPPLSVIKRPLREVVERYLHEQRIPYVNVDEAKKALFGGTQLRTFHFVVYRANSLNWLLYAAQLRKESREDLREWEKIFGPGFVAVIAKLMRDGSLRFQTLKGEEAKLQ